jgi:STE24 endopeptidase
VLKRIALLAVMSFAMLWLLGQVIDQPWFYAGLKVGAGDTAGTAMGLLLFSQWCCPCSCSRSRH